MICLLSLHKALTKYSHRSGPACYFSSVNRLIYKTFSARTDTQSINMHHTCIYVYAYTRMYFKPQTLKPNTFTLFSSCDIQPNFSWHNHILFPASEINSSTLIWWHWSWIVEYGKRYLSLWDCALLYHICPSRRGKFCLAYFCLSSFLLYWRQIFFTILWISSNQNFFYCNIVIVPELCGECLTALQCLLLCLFLLSYIIIIETMILTTY